MEEAIGVELRFQPEAVALPPAARCPVHLLCHKPQDPERLEIGGEWGRRSRRGSAGHSSSTSPSLFRRRGAPWPCGSTPPDTPAERPVLGGRASIRADQLSRRRSSWPISIGMRSRRPRAKTSSRQRRWAVGRRPAPPRVRFGRPAQLLLGEPRAHPDRRRAAIRKATSRVRFAVMLVEESGARANSCRK